MKVLFVCKSRGEPYTQPAPGTGEWQNRSFTGLQNSVRYVVDMLRNIGIEADSVRVADNNFIDAAVKKYQPTHVFIEALWVVPSKFPILVKLHPTVKWNVRLHSELPFISGEGIAMQWLFGYQKQPNVSISANSLRMQADLTPLLGKVFYTPNYYPLYPLQTHKPPNVGKFVDIGCFGAIRPLKNQLIQAFAAIEFAKSIGRTLRFHINSDRVEGAGLPILHNIQGLFAAIPSPVGQLVEHGWMDTADFTALVRMMDIGMQVSFTETFNIVSADVVTSNVPLVCSAEVTWAAPIYQANPNLVSDIVAKLHTAWNTRGLSQVANYRGLQTYDALSETVWPVTLAKI